MATISELLADPDFRALAPAEQLKIRAEFMESQVARDPDYRSLSPDQQLQIRREVLGSTPQPGLLSQAGNYLAPVGEATAGAAEKFGLGPLVGRPGLLENLTGPPTTEGSLLTGGVLPSVARGLDKGLAAAALLPVGGIPAAGAVAMGLGSAAQSAVELGGAATGKFLNTLRYGIPGVDSGLNLLGFTHPANEQLETTPFSQLIGVGASFGVLAAAPKALAATNTFGITSATSGKQPPSILNEPLALPPSSGITQVGPTRTFEAGPIQTGEVVQTTPIPKSLGQQQPRGVGKLLETVEAQRAELSQRGSIERTLDAANDLLTNRPLDLGQIGQKRARGAGELEYLKRGAPEGPFIVLPTDQTPGKVLLPAVENTARLIPQTGEMVSRTVFKFKPREVEVPLEETGKVRLGLEAPLSERLSMPQDLAEVLDAVAPGPISSPTRFAILTAQLKTKVDLLTPRIWGHAIHELLKDIPGAREMVWTAYENQNTAEFIRSHVTREFESAYRGLAPESIVRVNRALHGKLPIEELASEPIRYHRSLAEFFRGAENSNSEQAAFAKARVLFDQTRRADYLENYFPVKREVFEASEVARIGGTPITRVIEIVPGEKYIPVSTENLIPKKYVPSYAKQRTRTEEPSDYGLGPIRGYVNQYARDLALNGGTDPVTGTTVKPLLPVLREGVNFVPPELTETTLRWINDVLGVPTAKSGQLFGKNTEPIMRTAKNIQTIRLMGANAQSVIQNGLTDVLTFANSRTSSYLGSWKDMFDPTMWAEAARQNVIGQLSKSEYTTLRQLKIEEASGKIAQETLSLFRVSENLVRGKAYFTGLREAAAEGLTGEKAVSFAKRFTWETQGNYAREALPESFRSQGGIWSGGSQFKTFPMVFYQAIKNGVTRDIQNLGHELPFKRTIKFLTMSTALVGSDATFGGLDKAISKALTDDSEKLRVTGFFPALGIYLGNQINMGVLPVDSLRHFAFFLPGPMVSMVLDSVSAMGALVHSTPEAPYGHDYSLDSLASGKGYGSPMNADQLANKLTRLVPLSGVFFNRIRQALLERANNGDIKGSENLKQAFGMEKQTGEFIRKGDLGSVFKTALGVQDPTVKATQDLLQENRDLTDARNLAVDRAAMLFTSGKEDEAQKLLESFQKRWGTEALLTKSAIRAAIIRREFDKETRQQLKAPREMRELFLQRLQRLQAGEQGPFNPGVLP